MVRACPARNLRGEGRPLQRTGRRAPSVEPAAAAALSILTPVKKTGEEAPLASLAAGAGAERPG